MNRNIIVSVAIISTIAGGIIYSPQKKSEATPEMAYNVGHVNSSTPSENSTSEEAKKVQVEKEEALVNPPKNEEAKVEPTPAPTPVAVQKVTDTSVRTRNFRMNDGTIRTGQWLIDYVVGNPNGKRLYDAFYAAHGQVVADTAAISLFYENGTLWESTTGVCSPKFQIAGDYRNCNYADINSAGFDAGLKQINTWYQRFRIAKLGGPNCVQSNSRDRSDPCVQQLIAWLHNVDNNIKISLDIYAESGFTPWYGYKRAFNQ